MCARPVAGATSFEMRSARSPAHPCDLRWERITPVPAAATRRPPACAPRRLVAASASRVTRSQPSRSSRKIWRSSLGQPAVEAADVALFVVGERSVVEVRRADRHPAAIDDHRLLMEHGAVELVDLDARRQQAAEQPHAVVARQPVVVADARHHDAHVDASPLGVDQRVDRDRIRHEVRVGDVDRLARADDRQVVHGPHARRAGLRRAQDRLHGQWRPAGSSVG